MTGLPLTRHRAERFAGLVDPASGPGGDTDVDQGTAELLVLVGALRAVPDAQPRPQFSADLRERLVLAARTELTPTELTPAPARRPRERRIAVALAAVAIVGASSSMAVASQSALPGDALYPLKRGIEDTHARLSVGDQAEGTVLLHSAGDRLAEAQDMTADGGGDASRVTGTLDTFTGQLRQGADLLIKDYREHGDAQSIDVLRRFDSASMQTLTSLDGTVPEASEPALLAAAKELFTVDAAAGQLCPGCSTAGIAEIPPALVAKDTDVQVPDVTTPDVTTPPAPGTPSASARPTARPRPSSTSSSRPSADPTSPATNGPTTGPTRRVTPTDAVSSILGTATSRPSRTRLPTSLPTTSLLPSGLPSLGAVASGAASGVATSVSQLLNGLTSGQH